MSDTISFDCEVCGDESFDYISCLYNGNNELECQKCKTIFIVSMVKKQVLETTKTRIIVQPLDSKQFLINDGGNNRIHIFIMDLLNIYFGEGAIILEKKHIPILEGMDVVYKKQNTLEFSLLSAIIRNVKKYNKIHIWINNDIQQTLPQNMAANN